MIPILLAWLLAAGAQASGYRIAGVVVNAISRQPLSGARVTIAPVEHRDQQIPFVTGQDGHFVFAGIPQGKYELMAQRTGYLGQSVSGAVVTGAGQTTDAIVLPLSPPGIIAGKVVDDAGDPVAKATLQLIGSTIAGGRRRLATVSVIETGDTGEYRFAPLAAGTYYLAASGSPWYTKFNQTHGDSPPRPMTHTGYAIRYYPNAGEPDAAEPLRLKPSQEATADFALLSVPAATVTVHVEHGEELTKHYSLAAAGLPEIQVVVRQGTEVGDLYHFWGVPPGHYTLRVQASDAGHSLYGSAAVDVASTDTEAVVTLREAPSLAGTIAVEGDGSPASLSVLLFDMDNGSSVSLPVGANGRFATPALPPQRCRVALTGPPDFYLTGWTAEGGRREGEALDIPAGAAVRLKLSAGIGTSRIGGTVYRDGHPLPGALVVLADSAKPENSRAVPSDSDGSYEFRGVPAGSYRLFAVADGSDLEYAESAVIRPYLETAAKIHVVPAGSYTRRLDVRSATAGRPGAASPES